MKMLKTAGAPVAAGTFIESLALDFINGNKADFRDNLMSLHRQELPMVVFRLIERLPEYSVALHNTFAWLSENGDYSR